MSKHFKLFTNCFPVLGYSRSLLCDVQRSSFDFIPNGLFYILEKYNGSTIEQVLGNFTKEEQPIIEEYFEFLHEKEYLFYGSRQELDYFPPINTTWSTPDTISNAVIDISFFEIQQMDFVLDKLNTLGCKYYLFMTNTLKSVAFWELLIPVIQKYRVFSIEVYAPYSEADKVENLCEIMDKNPSWNVWCSIIHPKLSPIIPLRMQFFILLGVFIKEKLK